MASDSEEILNDSVHRPESLGCTLITTGLDENINHLPVLVDSPPQIPSLTLYNHEKFIQVPGVTQATLSSPEFPSVFNTKLPTPLSDRLVGYGNPMLCQEVFHISEAQAEAVVEPDSMADEIKRKLVSAIVGRVDFHSPSLLGSSQLDNTAVSVVSSFWTLPRSFQPIQEPQYAIQDGKRMGRTTRNVKIDWDHRSDPAAHSRAAGKNATT